MKCKEVKRLLGDFIGGALEDKLARIVSEHLRDCPGCASELKLERALDALFRASRELEAEAPELFEARVLAAMRMGREPAARGFWECAQSFANKLIIAATATFLILAAATYLLDGGDVQQGWPDVYTYAQQDVSSHNIVLPINGELDEDQVLSALIAVGGEEK